MSELSDLLTQLEKAIQRERRIYERDLDRISNELEDLKARAVVTLGVDPTPLPARKCNKRQYGSVKAAKQACQTLDHTMRVYECDDCGKYHTTKRDYR